MANRELSLRRKVLADLRVVIESKKWTVTAEIAGSRKKGLGLRACRSLGALGTRLISEVGRAGSLTRSAHWTWRELSCYLKFLPSKVV